MCLCAKNDLKVDMFGRFLPQETIFFDFFEQHAKKTLEAAKIFYQLTANEIEFNRQSNPIKILEHEADQITHQCMEYLHHSFITPLQQDDIFRLISRLDDVIDSIDEAFDDCLIYKIHSFTQSANELSHLLLQSIEKIDLIIQRLRDRKSHVNFIRENILLIHIYENEADNIFRQALGRLFDEEKDILLIIKWKEIYQVLEKGVDYCEDVSNIIEGIILEYD